MNDARSRLSTRSVPPDLAPRYDRSDEPCIAHLGVGAFARAHLGEYADQLLRAGHPALIRGVSLRSPRAEQALGPQDGLYTLTEVEAGDHRSWRVLGAFASVATGTEAAIAAIAAPATTLVTLTITEKGYDGIAPAVVAAGLDRRRAQGLPAPVVASLDNVAANGHVLRERVLAAAGAEPARWIDQEVRFPCSVVDRIVPAASAALLDEVQERLDLRDEAAVAAERHRSWVIEAVAGLPPLGDVGVEVVADTAPYQRRKLWLLNAPHSAVAYAGLLAGCATIAEAVVHPLVAPFVRRLVDDVLTVVDLPDPAAGAAFAATALARFANPELGHTCRQVGTDGAQKLTQRIVPAVAAREQRGLSTSRFALVVAAWQATFDDGPLPGPISTAFAAEVAGARARLRREGVHVLQMSEDGGSP